MPYWIMLAAALAVLALIWLPALLRSSGAHGVPAGYAPDGWAPYARSSGRYAGRHAQPRNYLPIGNYVRRAIASAALVVLIAWQRHGATAQTAA